MTLDKQFILTPEEQEKINAEQDPDVDENEYPYCEWNCRHMACPHWGGDGLCILNLS